MDSSESMYIEETEAVFSQRKDYEGWEFSSEFSEVSNIGGGMQRGSAPWPMQ